jgi:hypothetical protein
MTEVTEYGLADELSIIGKGNLIIPFIIITGTGLTPTQTFIRDVCFSVNKCKLRTDFAPRPYTPLCVNA